MIIKVSYRREVLISTKQYENQKVCVELSEDVDTSQTMTTREEAYNRVKRFVHDRLAEEIYAIKFGSDAQAYKQVDEEQRRSARMDAVRRANGL